MNGANGSRALAETDMEASSSSMAHDHPATGAEPSVRVRLVLKNGAALRDVVLLRVGGRRPASAADLISLLAAALESGARPSFLTYAVAVRVEVVPIAWVERLEVAGPAASLRDGSYDPRRGDPVSGFVLRADRDSADVRFRSQPMEGGASCP